MIQFHLRISFETCWLIQPPTRFSDWNHGWNSSILRISPRFSFNFVPWVFQGVQGYKLSKRLIPQDDDSLETRGLRRGGNSSTMAFPQFSGTLWDQLTWLAMENPPFLIGNTSSFMVHVPACDLLVYQSVSAIGFPKCQLRFPTFWFPLLYRISNTSLEQRQTKSPSESCLMFEVLYQGKCTPRSPKTIKRIGFHQRLLF